ncbi:MAG: NUDIX domain-containing protein [Rhodobacterales bacterium]|nr:NUDIX domain-containing protein [Rhodobacterales bacterium]MDX5499270.1 NUDIX domain-containing protein [Rhodobacterales bacterium]
MALIDAIRRLLARPSAALQVAMLCTRQGPDGPEVLLVKSLDSGRWILPKGWPMPGRSLAEAAAQEAWEEAGARGRVAPDEIARIPANKRLKSGLDVPCELVVFRMDDVTLADDYPEAAKRKRRMLPAAKAAARADIEELGDLIRHVFS